MKRSVRSYVIFYIYDFFFINKTNKNGTHPAHVSKYKPMTIFTFIEYLIIMVYTIHYNVRL